MRRSLLLIIALLALVLAACSGGPGDSSGVVRTVAVSMTDDMGYDPTEFDFFAGDSVRFEVTNEGAVRHELFVGDVAAHEEHAAEMAEMGESGMGHDEANGVSVEPGQTEALAMTFAEAGALLVGCHEPGHYEAGMVADITIHP
jgi:uncharacterized cupredoxin-like copper-binding protein